MKCSFCGKELEKGATFCPECGTILSIDDDNEKATVPTFEENEKIDIYSDYKKTDDEDLYKVPEYTPPVFEEPVYTEPVEEVSLQEAEEVEDDPFVEMHPDETINETVEEESEEEPSEPIEYDIADLADEYGIDKDDMLISDSKSKKGVIAIAVLVVVLIAVVTGGIYALKNTGSFPFIEKTTDDVNASVSDTVSKTTEEKTTKKKDNKTTTEKKEKDTTEKETTKKEDKTTAEPTTKKEETTTAPSTTESTTVHTTQATTAATTAQTTQSTTAATTAQTTQVVTKPSTTQATTSGTTAAQPTTQAKPQLQKPSTTISKFTAYATTDGVSLRYAPSTSAARILYLSVGADLVVTGESNGFYYVYSNRYGVNGWVSKSYVSTSRPVAEKQQNVSGVVTPDSNTGSKTMYVNTTSGLYLRKGPGTNYDIIRTISNGYPVVVKGSSSSVAGWVYVTDTTHGVSGWVSSAYLK